MVLLVPLVFREKTLKDNISYYLAGFIVKSILQKLKCVSCLEMLIAKTNEHVTTIMLAMVASIRCKKQRSLDSGIHCRVEGDQEYIRIIFNRRNNQWCLDFIWWCCE